MSAGTLDLNKDQYTEVDTFEIGEDREDAHVKGQDVVVQTDDVEDVEAAADKDSDGIHGNRFTKGVEEVERHIVVFYSKNKGTVWLSIKLLALVMFLSYLFYVMYLNLHRALPLVLLTIATASYFLFQWLWKNWGSVVDKNLICPCTDYLDKHQKAASLFVKFFMVVSLLTILTASGVFTLIFFEPIRLVSLLGLVFLLVVSFLGSKYPSRINWMTVTWGLYLQVLFGIFILRTDVGFYSFKWIGAQVEIFLNYALVGADFVFGPDPLKSHFFLFIVLPVVIFASAIFALLFYFGVMQKLIKAFAWLMHHTMGVSGVEAFCAAANVFLGMTLVPLCVKPYLLKMTTSEIHSLMVGGFATIAGSVLAAYINMGISAAHLLSASIISAPAALVAAKMFYPETERPKTANSGLVKIDCVKEKNFIEAFCNGAIDGTKVCGFIIGNLIAFVSFLAFVDMTLHWLGDMADIENLSFTLLCSYLLYPFALLLGVEPGPDCIKVAGLIGTKTFVNEFVAYSELKDYIKEGALQARSEVIATYALCGFSNFGSIGILIGGLAPLVPEKISEISRLGLRALIAGSVACQMTACVAGILYDESRQHFSGAENITTVANLFTDGPLTTTFPSVESFVTDLFSTTV